MAKFLAIIWFVILGGAWLFFLGCIFSMKALLFVGIALGFALAIFLVAYISALAVEVLQGRYK